MNVTIAVRPTEDAEKKDADAKAGENAEGDAAAKKGSKTGSSASSRHGQASAAREYLDQHNLVEFTQLLVQSVIKEQPDKPYAFMARQFYFPDPKPRPNTCPTMDNGKAEVVVSDPGAKAPKEGAAPLESTPLQDGMGGVPAAGSTPVLLPAAGS
jgi:hypothetical protein